MMLPSLLIRFIVAQLIPVGNYSAFQRHYRN